MRFLLLQVRDAADPMRTQEVGCFARSLQCSPSDLAPFDLLGAAPTTADLSGVDAALVGGSGAYSAAGEGAWLERALIGLQRVVDSGVPMFASCWGFQALARALGGVCIHDPQRAELGTIELSPAKAAAGDPVFGQLPSPFLGQAGHEDCVTELPDNAILLASSPRTTNQAFKLRDRPVYCTQFHPELDRHQLLERVAAYPRYVEQIAGVSYEQFRNQCRETPDANALLLHFKEFIAQRRNGVQTTT